VNRELTETTPLFTSNEERWMLHFTRLGVEVSVTGFKFEEFELYPQRRELRQSGRPVKIENIPLTLLTLLVEKKGDLVSRKDIGERLWGADVFLDTEHGINTAIRKIRLALKDNPDQPRFVQTVTSRGYRFIAQVIEPPDDTFLTIEPSASLSNSKVAAQTQEAAPPPSVPPPTGDQPSHSAGPKSALQDEGWHKTSSKIISAIAVVSLLLLAAFALFAFRARVFPSRVGQIHSVAVIPLVNLSGDASQDYYADGMTDELITALAKNRNLRVVSHTSVRQYKGVTRPLREIARELNVDGILEGSIERTPSNVHMNVQLIYGPTDTHVWAESYDRDISQSYAIPQEFASTVAKEVKAATSAASGAHRYISPEAHDAYLRGRYFWLSFDTKQSIAFFQKAIDLQPDYAAAWSGLADSYLFATLSDIPLGPAGPLIEKAGVAAHKAVELDDLLPEAHNSIARTAFLRWNVALADVENRRALELDPNLPEGHYLHYQILLVELQNDAALQEAKIATQLDPFSRPWGMGYAYVNVRQFDNALHEFLLQSQARPNDPEIRYLLSEVYWLKNMYNESEIEFEKANKLSDDSATAAALHRAFEQGGESAVERYSAEKIKAHARKAYVPALEIAEAVSYTGDKDETMKYLEEAYREHSTLLVWVWTEPLFDFLHSDPRFQALVKKMGLPASY
jgi:TolB-like protein/DNA-binding winged helix-turn-helix (wHTH) protein